MTDAGERRRMLVLCPFPPGVAAGQRLKYEQYLDDWRHQGWDVTLSPYMDMALWTRIYAPGGLPAKVAGVWRGHQRRLRDLARIGRYDLVYVFLWVTPLGTTWPERIVRARARRLVFDVEDNLLGTAPPVDRRAPNPLARWFKGPGKARFLARTADAVVVASPALAEPCRTLNRHGRVYCIPPSLDMDRIVPAAVAPPADPVVLGWTGTFSSRPYLDRLAPVLRRLATRVPFRLRVIGNFDYALDGVAVDVVRWTAEREAADLQSLHIGLYPLPDDPWTRGKAGLKIIQYQAAGLPCVASDVPLSRAQIRQGETGFLAGDEDEWLHTLERLARDPRLRARVGAQARIDAVARYSQAAVAPLYRALLAEVAAGPA